MAHGSRAPRLGPGRRLALAAGLLLSCAGCAATRPAEFAREDEACYRPRRFSEEIPSIYWGDPVRDPCWRYRPFITDR